VGKGNDPHLRRAGDPDDHDAERAALRHELGMGAVRVPLPLDVDTVLHGDHDGPHEVEASTQSLMDLISHQKPPVETHFVDGALDEHARHEHRAESGDDATA
jgi:hypothetical protein